MTWHTWIPSNKMVKHQNESASTFVNFSFGKESKSYLLICFKAIFQNYKL